MNPVVCWHSVKSQLFCSLLFCPLRLAAFLWSSLYLQLPVLLLSVPLSIKVSLVTMINTFPSLHIHTELSWAELSWAVPAAEFLQCSRTFTWVTWSRNSRRLVSSHKHSVSNMLQLAAELPSKTTTSRKNLSVFSPMWVRTWCSIRRCFCDVGILCRWKRCSLTVEG